MSGDEGRGFAEYEDLFTDAETVARELGHKITVIPRNDFDYKMGLSRDAPAPSTSISIRVTEQMPELKKTCKTLLEEGSRRMFRCSPVYETAIISSDDDKKQTFQVTCKVGSRIGIGKARLAQEARHIAAAEVLRQIIMDGSHQDYGIPGATKEEAYQYVFDCVPEPKNAKALNAEDNWIGNLNELCQQAKCILPQYAEERKEDGTFEIVCVCHNRETKAQAISKKAAKNSAAQSMFTEIHHSLRQIIAENEAAKKAAEALMSDCMQVLEKCLDEVCRV
ncbi:hypothetical protein QR680_014153 [Steinernema hermaphroditum]|uniref:DRBM domain-containing protein n=1 Tax=Steinernema hermaphroditum TaxID=289476 RepID=A0AA39I7V6_9BILA|nr:hypothetical protein QR680_014153 [Steinernema hermaphroditum]